MQYQVSRTDYGILGILCFVIGGYVISAWMTFMVWEILKTPVDIGLFMEIWSLVGASGFGIIGLGVRLIRR